MKVAEAYFGFVSFEFCGLIEGWKRIKEGLAGGFWLVREVSMKSQRCAFGFVCGKEIYRNFSSSSGSTLQSSDKTNFIYDPVLLSSVFFFF